MTFDEYFSRGVPKVNAPNVFRTSDGQYVNDQDQPLRVINNSLSDNPAMWTYQDELGKIYTPKLQIQQPTIQKMTEDEVQRASDRKAYKDQMNALADRFNTAGNVLMNVANFIPAGSVTTTPMELADGLKQFAKYAVEKAPSIRVGNWFYRIPKDKTKAYRIMDRIEADDILSGMPLRSRIENDAAAAYDKTRSGLTVTTPRGSRFNFFKGGAEHGGRKQFSKGQPWTGTTVTHEKRTDRRYLGLPGDGLDWVPGRHYHGARKKSLNFNDIDFGQHIDLKMEDGYTDVIPAEIPGSYIYQPYKLFNHPFGYKRIDIPKYYKSNIIK